MALDHASNEVSTLLSEWTSQGDNGFMEEIYRFVDKDDGKEYVELHVDFLSRRVNEKNHELRKALGVEGSSYSVRFD